MISDASVLNSSVQNREILKSTLARKKRKATAHLSSNEPINRDLAASKIPIPIPIAIVIGPLFYRPSPAISRLGVAGEGGSTHAEVTLIRNFTLDATGGARYSEICALYFQKKELNMTDGSGTVKIQYSLFVL